MINEVPTFRVDHMPYGGIKSSGMGREGVKFAIAEMTELEDGHDPRDGLGQPGLAARSLQTRGDVEAGASARTHERATRGPHDQRP